MMSNDVRRTGTEKGVFDHLAEYLLQQPVASSESPSPEPRTAEPRAAPVEAEVPPPAPPAMAGEPDLKSQELIFAETAERLVVEKEVVIREEVVLSKLVDEHVERIEDRVRRTEVEVERISPEEAAQIAKPSEPQTAPASASVDANEVAEAPAIQPEPAPLPVSPKRAAPTGGQTARPSAESKAWWAWFALIVCAGLLVAFAMGQFLGSAG
jgi:hypothetical protein